MEHNAITPFAKTNFRNTESVFGIKTDDRRRHMYVIGKTGMGKTNMLENLAIQDIRNGHGMCFIDPHGDSAEKLIGMIPPDRINDVIYFNPGDQDFPIAFNVMEQVPAEYRPLVASGIIGVFQKLWADSWGPRLEYILRNAILALLEYPGSTLLGIMRILVDKKYRERVVAHVEDPIIKAFWINEFTKWNERVLQEVISPIQNKVGQFLTSPLIRNVIGQTHSAFNVREAMDDRKILILNLAKGRIGEDNAALLGAMMITKIQLAAMGRVDTLEDDRKDFYLYVDEFQNFATESFANILSEARKYRLNLVLANQYIAQLQDEVRDAVFGNAGTLVSFRIGAADAEAMEKEFEPIFMMNDIVNLPKYNIYLKLMIDGVSGDAFSATVLPPVERIDDDSAEKVIKVSRERYASDRVTVEDSIKSWSGMSPSVSSQARAQNQQQSQSSERLSGASKKNAVPVPAQTDAQSQIQLHDAICDACGISIQVPFKPDGSRPVFCKECLKEHQRRGAEKSTQKHKKIEHSQGGIPQKVSQKKEDVSTQKTVGSHVPQTMTLVQAQNTPPQKFTRSRVEVDTAGVKNLINRAQSTTDKK